MRRNPNHHVQNPCSVFLTVLLMSVTLVHARGGDWPQILGPNRNGIASNEKLLKTWPATGPKKLWTVPLGSGFAGPAVVENNVFVFHRIDDNERLEVLSAADGKRVWKVDYPASYQAGFNPDDGPRCVPLVTEQDVICFGAAGNLYCVDRGGRKRWERDLAGEYGAAEGYFGAGSCPIVIDDLVIVNVGGKRRNAGLVAVRLKDGKDAWTAVAEDASYSSPIVVEIGGKKKLVAVTRLKLMVVDPTNGKVEAEMPFGMRGPTVNAANPIFFQNNIFVTASYGIGAALLSIDDGTKLNKVWANDNSMSSQYNTPIYRNGYLYGIHGREDAGPADLRCIEAMTGKVVWAERRFGVAHLISVGDRMIALTADGSLRLLGCNPDGFKKIEELSISRDTTRAQPALSDGRLYVRINRGRGGYLVSLQVGE